MGNTGIFTTGSPGLVSLLGLLSLEVKMAFDKVLILLIRLDAAPTGLLIPPANRAIDV